MVNKNELALKKLPKLLVRDEVTITIINLKDALIAFI